ncbi:DUF3298 and DUF4163 domain-containing protein [Lachnospiraceae bacterium OttesenSCG-928-D06]|nr:DUF3298 and DUF4163 domain-containing protein [Lachnospiraceae bacterium OttesenSCG-928-D06]
MNESNLSHLVQDPENPGILFCEYFKEIKSHLEKTAVYYHLKIPMLAGTDSAALAINKDIWESYNKLLTYASQRAKENLEFCEQEQEEEIPPETLYKYTYDANYQITYCTEHYICILIEGYEYAGGAHGMPFRYVLIYNRQTGEPVKGEKLFSITKESVKELRKQAFAQVFKEHPENYWDNVLQIVEDSKDFFETGYYLSPNGVVFYYAPYELAAYVYGFTEATVPYTVLPLL